MIHANLSPVPENISQTIFIEADTHSIETSMPKPDWFSPYSDEVATLMHKLGFKNIIIKFFETQIHLNFEEALIALRNWTVNPDYIEKHRDDLLKYGIEYPMEYVIYCRK